MITRRLTHRIVGWTVALNLAVALGTSVSASATTDTTGSRQYEPDYTCVDLHWAEDNVLEATQCEPEHNGPIVDSFDVEGRMLGAPVTFHCGYGFGIVDTIRGFDCERVRSSDRCGCGHLDRRQRRSAVRVLQARPMRSLAQAHHGSHAPTTVPDAAVMRHRLRCPLSAPMAQGR